MDTLVIWVAVATIVSAFLQVIQIIIEWYTLRELGDVDGDRKDWFEKRPWRKYRKDE